MRSLGWGAIGGVMCALAIATGCGRNKPETPAGGALGSGVLVQVNEAKLTESDLQRLIPAELREGITGPEIREILDHWARTELLYQRATGDGLDRDRDVAARLVDMKRELLADELLQRELEKRIRVTNEELQEHYRTHRDEYTQELQLKHVLVNTREEAEEILALARTGTPFEELARQRSRDVTAARGGDLGFLGKGAMYPAFEAHVFNQPPGQVVGPIATTFGFHVVKVAATRPASEPLSFDAVRDEIMHSLLLKKQQAAQLELLEDLRRGSRVQMATTYAGMTLEKVSRADEPREAPGRAQRFEPDRPLEAADSLATVHE